jgi:hypothetical protein
VLNLNKSFSSKQVMMAALAFDEHRFASILNYRLDGAFYRLDGAFDEMFSAYKPGSEATTGPGQAAAAFTGRRDAAKVYIAYPAGLQA